MQALTQRSHQIPCFKLVDFPSAQKAVESLFKCNRVIFSPKAGFCFSWTSWNSLWDQAGFKLRFASTSQVFELKALHPNCLANVPGLRGAALSSWNIGCRPHNPLSIPTTLPAPSAVAPRGRSGALVLRRRGLKTLPVVASFCSQSSGFLTLLNRSVKFLSLPGTSVRRNN